MATVLAMPDDESRELVNLSGQPTALEAVTRAEIDIQIATAKRFPRSIERFIKEATAMVSISPELAAQCTYVLPGRKAKGADGVMRPISGPSVRLAEMIACTWGNLRVVGRIVADDGKSITAQGVCMDLERNVGYEVEVRRGVTTSQGRRYSPDMVNMTCNAAIAIATRNATFKTVPRAFVAVIQDRAREIAAGDVKTLPERAARAVKHFTAQGITAKEVYAALGVAGPADMNFEHLEMLQGFKTSVSEGIATLNDIFRPAPAPADPRKPGENAADALTRQMQEQAAAPEEAPPSPREPGEYEDFEEGIDC